MCKDSVTEKMQHVVNHPGNKHVFYASDNAANQSKNNYHFSWMIVYVEDDPGPQMVQQNYTAEQHRKGAIILLLKSTSSKVGCFANLYGHPMNLTLHLGVWDTEGGGGKTGDSVSHSTPNGRTLPLTFCYDETFT